jgi:hypothetical protein
MPAQACDIGKAVWRQQQKELHMTSLPSTGLSPTGLSQASARSAGNRAHLFGLMFAIPLSLAGTVFLSFLMDAGSRITG